MTEPFRRDGGAALRLALAVAALSSLLAVAPAGAASLEWDAGGGAGNRNWSNPTNWTANTEPTSADLAYINGGFTGVVSQAGERASDLYVGSTNMPSNGANRTGRLEQVGGDLVVGSSFYLGKYAGGVGAYVATGGTLTITNRLMVGDQGLGTFTITNEASVTVHGDTVVGNAGVNAETPGSRLIVGGGTLTLNNPLRVGGDNTTNSAADGTLDVYGGRVDVNAIMKLGDNDNSTGRVTVAGGVLALAADLYNPENLGALGIMNVSGVSTTQVAGTNYVSRFLGSTGFLTVSGGLFTASATEVGNVNGATGAMTMAGGTYLSGELIVGRQGDGALVVSGGAVTAQVFAVSYAPNGRGSLAVSGGRLVVTSAGENFSMRRRGGTVNVSGGTVVANGVAVGNTLNHNSSDVPATLHLSGGTLSGGFDNDADLANDFRIATIAGATGVVHITGGVLDLSRANNDLVIGRGTNALAYFTMGGGTATVGGVAQVGVAAGGSETEDTGEGYLFLTNGLFSVAGNLSLPIGAGATAGVAQAGGRVDVGGDVTIGNENGGGVGRYTIGGGTLTNAGSLLVGHATGGSGFFGVAGGSPAIRVGALTMTSRGELRSAFNGAALAPIHVAQTIAVDGVLSVTNTGYYLPGTYVVATSASGTAISGTFATTNWLGGITGTVSYANNRIAITFTTNTTAADISGQVRLDADGDGDLADADAGIERAIVTLYTDPNADGDPSDGVALATNLTGSGGAYAFTNRAATSYVIVQTDRAGYRSTADRQGANDNRIAVTLDGVHSTSNDFLDTYDLVAKTVDQDLALVGSTLAYTVTPYYAGSLALTNVVVTDRVPTGTAYVASSANAGGVFSNGVLTWSLGSTAPGVPGATARNQLLYAFQGNTTTNFWSYDPVGGSWNTSLPGAPATIAAGGALATDGDRYLYALRGGATRSFYRYDAIDNAWSDAAVGDLPAAAATVSSGGSLAYLDGFVYAFVGGGNAGFWRYTVSSDAWTNLTSAPATISGGGSLATDGTNIFATRGGATTTFWMYHVASGTWSNRAVTARAVADGSRLAYTDAGIYLTDGNRLYRYSIGANTWTEITPRVGATGLGGSLAYDGAYLYKFDGAGTTFRNFTVDASVTTNQSTVLTAAPGSVNVGGALVYLASGYVTTSTLAAASSLVGGSGEVTVTLTLQSSVTVSNVTPAADLTTNITGSVTVSKVAGPTPPSADVSAGGTSFTYVYQLTAGTTTGAVSFAGGAASPSGIFASATSDGILVSPRLVFQAAITNPPGVEAIVNAAGIDDDGSLPATNSPAVTTLVRSVISGQVRNDTDGDGDFGDADDGIAGVAIVLWTDPNSDGDPVDGVAIATNVTDAGGNFSFTYVATGSYVLVETDPANFRSTADSQGANDNRIALTFPPVRHALSNDFLDTQAADITGQVREDDDGDGDLGDSDDGITNVTIVLWTDPNSDGDPADGIAIATNLTDASGNFALLNVLPGAYVVQETDPSGFNSTADSQGANDNRIALVLTGAVDSVGHAFLDARPSTISGQVREDADGDGDLGDSDDGIANVTIVLWSDPDGDGDPADGIAMATNITDGSGNYAFPSNMPGTYVVVETDPAGFYSTADSQGANDNRIAVTLVSSTDSTGNDFLDARPSTISGQVREDADGDGDLGDSDDGIAGVTIVLWTDPNGDGDPADGVAAATNVTDSSGYYSFPSNVPGTYVVVETDPDGFNSTADSQGANDNRIAMTLVSSTDSTDNDFLDAEPADISGQVREDDDGDGNLGDSDDGITNVTIVLWTDPNSDGDPVDGVAVATNVTDSSGNYSFPSNMPGTYVVVETDPSGFISTADSQGANDNRIAVALLSDLDSTGHDFLDTQPVTVSGQVRYDVDGDADFGDADDGITNVTIVLWTDPNGDGDPVDGIAIATNVTDAGGFYSFEDVTPGAYVIVETDPPNFLSSADTDGANDNRIAVTLTSGVDSGGHDFLDKQLADIYGQVREDADGDGDLGDSDDGITNVTIVLWTDPNSDGDPVDGVAVATNVTDSLGNYAFISFGTGGYVIVETDPDGFNSTADRQGANDNRIAVTLPGGVHSYSNDFLDAHPAVISGQVREDADGDGDLGDSDNGITNVTIVLWTDPNGDGDPADGIAIATNATDASGNYSFPSNMPGTYVVVETDPDGFYSTTDSQGANDNRIAVTLVSSTDSTGNDFLDTRPSTISGQVREDADGDGDLGDSDDGITNVTIVLWTDPNGDGDPVDGVAVATNVTDGAGSYSFPSNMPGTYVVVETDPDGFNSTADSQGANDNRIAVTLVSSTDSTGNDFLDARPSTISGQVREDADGDGDLGDSDDGIAGVTIVLWTDPNSDGDPVDGVGLATNVTDSSGNYAFPSNMPGTYVVVETDPAGFYSTADSGGANDNRIAVTLVSSTYSTGNDFLDTRPSTISGQVREDADGDGDLGDADDGITNVTIVLWTDPNGDGDPGDGIAVATNATDVSGNYSFPSNVPGTYVVVETDPDWFNSTADSQGANDNRIAVTLVSSTDSTGNDFLDAEPADISGQVREDADADGDLGDSDDGITNVTIVLWTDPNSDGDPVDGVAVATNVTDSSGNYAFPSNMPGTYVVVETDPDGFISTADSQGANDNRIAIALISGTDSTGNDFLDTQTADIGGQVRNDTDGDGDFGDADDGIADVTIVLWSDPNGDGDPADGVALSTNITDGAGYFFFPSNVASTYVLVETDPADFRSTADSQGANDNRIALVLQSGIHTSTNYFLDSQTADIGGQVRHDIDGDGSFADPDGGLTNVTVVLYTDPDGDSDPADGIALATNLTGTGGSYLFVNVGTGRYVVVETDLAGYVSTADADAPNDNRIRVTLTGAVNSVSNDFLDARLLTVGGQVRHDIDGDGNLGDADSGLASVTVTLWTDPNADGNPADGVAATNAATDADGLFAFSNLFPGTYVVVETDLAGYVSTADSQGANDNRVAVALTNGLDVANVAFLDSQLVNISGQVRHDIDADGDFSDADAGLTNVTIVLWSDPNGDGDPADGAPLRTNLTNTAGNYSFTGLLAGTYVVVETDPAGYVSTADTQGANDNRIAIALSAVLNSSGNNFLDTRPVTISGQVRLDADADGDLNDTDAGLAGATVRLFTDPDRDGDPADGTAVATNVTTISGDFSFTNLLAAGYVLVETDPAGYVSTADSVGLNDNRIARIVSSGVNSTNNVFLDAVAYDPDLPGVTSNMETIVAGSWIIPMDNTKQNIGAAFNLKAYGLLASLLHSNIPVKWAIRAGKAKDQADFTAYAQRIYPSSAGATNADYLAGPFIIPKIFTNQAASVISAYGNSVAVYELLSNVTVDVRYTLNTRPVVAALNDGGTIAIHVNALLAGGFVEGVSFIQGYAFSTNPISTNSCYSFASEPHFEVADPSPQAQAIRGFVAAQGNFLAQCIGVASYENNTNGRFQTSHGIVLNSVISTFTYPHADLPYGQFEGALSDDGGSFPEWKLLTNSAWINDAHMQVQGVQETNTMKASHGKVQRGRTGGNVFYLGGHDYSATTIGDLNGRRMYLNAVFVPSLRPIECGLTFGADIGITKTDGSLYAPAGRTNVYTIVVTNIGPDAALNVRVTDNYPPDFTNVSWSAVGAGGAVVPNATGSGGTNLSELVDLPKGATVTFSVSGLVVAAGNCILSNVVTVTVPENVIDVVATNNSAYDTSITHVIDLGGHVRNDVDGDGDLLDAEAGLSNVTVRLWTDPNGDGDPADGALSGTRITDADGAFLFTNVTIGYYVLEETDPAGFLSTADSYGTNDNLIAIHVECGITDNSTNNAFLDSQNGSISGQVREDADADGDLGDADNGITNVTVVLWTDPNGDGNPADGVAIATNVTSATGTFVFPGITTGSYVIVESDPAGHVSTADSQGANDNRIAVSMPGGVNSPGHVFLDTKYVSVSGQVREDVDGDGDLGDADAGITNVTIVLWTDPNGDSDPADGIALVTNVTDSSGNYVFTNVIAGRYVVVETDLPGYASTADSQGANDNRIAMTLTSGVDRAGNDFLDTRPADVLGQVRDDTDGDGDLGDADDGITNVTIVLWTDPDRDGDPVDGIAIRTNLTDAGGNYAFTNLTPGYYVIVETDPAGYQSTADKDGGNLNQIVLAHLSGVTSTSNDFLDTRTASIGGFVREDQDGDADLADPDPGISSVTVVLFSDPNQDGDPSDGTALATNLTDGVGAYVFPFLNPGSYVVVETDPAGYYSTADSQGANDNRIAVNLPGGVNSTNNLFLDARPADIGGQVRNDEDGDGDLGDADDGIANVTITLWSDPDRDGNPADGMAILTNLTDSSGYYTFAGVNPGYYVIVETDPPGFQSTADRDGGNLNQIVLAHRSGVTTNGNDFLDSVRAAIRGQVRNDIDGDGDLADPDVGISDTTVTLYTDPNGDGDPSDGVAVATNLTDTSGFYAFPALPTGRYVVVETDRPGYNSTADTDPPNDNRIRVVLPGGVDSNGNDFLDDPDRVFKTVDTPIASVGDTLTYTIATFYAGNQPLTNVVATDRVPTGTAYVAGSANAGGVFTNGVITWSLGHTTPGVQGADFASAVTSLTATADTWIDENAPAANNGSNNRLRTRPSAGARKYSLAQFDLSSIPTGAIINSAVLSVEVQTSRNNHSANVHRVETTWTEAGATWNTRDGSATWRSNSFGDLDYAPGVLGSIVPNSTGVRTVTVTTAVNDWVNNGFTNNGFVLVAGGTDNGDAVFYSREEGTASRRPSLAVNWTAPGTTNEVDVIPSLVSATSTISVTMRLVSHNTITNVVPPASLLTNATGGVTAELIGGPEPASANVGTSGTAFVYLYRIISGVSTGTLSFSGNVASPSNRFVSATSDRIIVAPLLTFQAVVTNPAGVSAVTNFASLTETNFIPTTNSNFAVTELRSAISGQVREDLDGDASFADPDPGLTNVTVTLFTDPNGDGDPADGVAVATNLTDAGGNYRFALLATGRYVVVETDPAGAVSTADTQGTNDNRIAVHLAQISLSQSNVFLDTYPVTVSGQVRDDVDADGDPGDPDPGLSNVTVRLFTDPNADGNPADGVAVATNLTDGSGAYAFTLVRPGAYVVVETDPPSYSSTADRDGGNLNQIALVLTSRVDSTGNYFLDTRLATINGYVRHDLDGDGDVLEADPGLTNVAVILYTDPNGDGDPADGMALITNRTDSAGLFVFTGNDTGTYVLVEVDPADYVSTADSDPPNDNRIRVTLTGGTNSTGNVFLDAVLASIGGQVRNDTDGDGSFADPDAGLEGATVTLFTDPNGDGNPADGTSVISVVTTSAGTFLFTNNMPGRYVLVETDPDGFASTADSQGANDNRIAFLLVSGTPSISNIFLDASYAGVSILKTVDSPGDVDPGQVLTYTVTISNTGVVPHTGALVTDAMSPVLAYVTGTTWVVTGSNTVRDEFNAVAYTNSDGTLSWSTAWTEEGESDGPAGGRVLVTGGELRLSEKDRGISRSANLAAYTLGTLSFDYRIESFDNSGDFLTLYASSNGSTWSQLHQWVGPIGLETGTLSLNVAPYLASNTAIRYLTSPNMKGDDLGFFDNINIGVTAVTTGGAPPNLIQNYVLNTGQTVIITFQAVPDAAEGITNIACVTTAYLTNGLCSEVTNAVNPLLLTQGLVRAYGSNDGFEVSWTAVGEPITREYDVLYVDRLTPGFNAALTAMWSLAATVTNSYFEDLGSSNRPPPWNMGNAMRFFRAAHKGRWSPQLARRNASREIYVGKAIQLQEGENFVSLFMAPDSDTAAAVLGTNVLPAAPFMDEATHVEWYGATRTGQATNTIWLDSLSQTWRYSDGGDANNFRLPLREGFNVVIPAGAGPQTLPVIGRMPTNILVSLGHIQTIRGTQMYNIVSYNLPYRVRLGQSRLREAGFRGVSAGQTVNPLNSDELRILQRGGGSFASPKARILMNSSSQFVFWTGGSGSAENYELDVDDALIIYTRKSTNDWTWTLTLPYPVPTIDMNP